MVQRTVSGLEIQEGWEERFQQLGDLKNVQVDIQFNRYEVNEYLSREEFDRNQVKLQLLIPLVKQLAVGMLKGTLKYSTDVHTPEEWGRERGSELGDYINYLLLSER